MVDRTGTKEDSQKTKLTRSYKTQEVLESHECKNTWLAYTFHPSVQIQHGITLVRDAFSVNWPQTISAINREPLLMTAKIISDSKFNDWTIKDQVQMSGINKSMGNLRYRKTSIVLREYTLQSEALRFRLVPEIAIVSKVQFNSFMGFGWSSNFLVGTQSPYHQQTPSFNHRHILIR